MPGRFTLGAFRMIVGFDGFQMMLIGSGLSVNKSESHTVTVNGARASGFPLGVHATVDDCSPDRVGIHAASTVLFEMKLIIPFEKIWFAFSGVPMIQSF